MLTPMNPRHLPRLGFSCQPFSLPWLVRKRGLTCCSHHRALSVVVLPEAGISAPGSFAVPSVGLSDAQVSVLYKPLSL